MHEAPRRSIHWGDRYGETMGQTVKRPQREDTCSPEDATPGALTSTGGAWAG